MLHLARQEGPGGDVVAAVGRQRAVVEAQRVAGAAHERRRQHVGVAHVQQQVEGVGQVGLRLVGEDREAPARAHACTPAAWLTTPTRCARGPATPRRSTAPGGAAEQGGLQGPGPRHQVLASWGSATGAADGAMLPLPGRRRPCSGVTPVEGRARFK
ncbi:MAG: hypothetical protein R3F43_08550 [bacterium]